MATNPAPSPTRSYTFSPNTPAVSDYVNHELDTIYGVLQGSVGNVHIADQAGILGTKIAAGSIPAAQVKAEPWTSFTSTLVGWSGSPTQFIHYITVGKTCTIYFNMTGTSNSTTTSFTIPAYPLYSQNLASCRVTDSGIIQATPGLCILTAGVITVNCFLKMDGTGFSNTGTKTLEGVLVYETQ
ncbi:MAG: hypothetical protein NVS1B10_07010 [Candidatus Saccharimonadales bacterium]